MRRIPSYNDYSADKCGNIYSHKHGQCKLMSPYIGNKGYKMLLIHMAGVRKNKSVHRLIAEAYLDNYSESLYVNHINGVKTDNRVENLEMCTNQENMDHARISGLILSKQNHSMAKLTNVEVIFIKNLLASTSISQGNIGKMFGVSKMTINHINIGLIWRDVEKYMGQTGVTGSRL